MYWFRNGSSLELLPWLAVLAVVWLGGWLLASHAFRLRSNERLVTGLALGVVLYAWFINLIGRWLSPELVFYISALVVLALGSVFAWRSPQRPWLDRRDLSAWPLLLAGLGLVWLFLLWSKGLALFDEHKNLSLISIIANGEIPPRFLSNSNIFFSYHYGFHLFAASLMKLGGMLPWSAFDTAKSIAWGVTVLLAVLLGKRVIGSNWGGWLAAAALVFASGTRFLLLLLPPGLLLAADRVVQLQGTSALIARPFSEALLAGWPVDGGPPFPYPFAFLNGILQPFVMAHQGPNTFSLLILLLLWLLAARITGRWSAVILTPVFAMWALVWETSYALFVVGLAGFALLYYLRMRSLELPNFKAVGWATLASIPLALLQGGTFTEMARGVLSAAGPLAWLPAATSVGANLVSSLLPSAATPAAAGVLGFSLRWPPAIFSSHLGALSIFSPLQLLVGLFELGPIIIFVPWLSVWAWRRARAGEWIFGVMLLSAWAGFLMPVVLQYEADRDISRLASQAMLIWFLMLVFLLADRSQRWKPYLRQVGIAAVLVSCIGGFVVAAVQLTAASTTQLGDNFNKLDASISALMWGTIDKEDRVYGPLGSTTILSGHLTGELLDEGSGTSGLAFPPETLDLEKLSRWYYDYLYIDSRWWEALPPETRESAGLDAACVLTVAEVWDNSHVNYRRLLDLQACH